MAELKPGHVWFEVMNGPEGPSLYIGDDDSGYRLAGPKPMSARPVFRFMVDIAALEREARAYAGIEAARGGQHG
ncbi:hypothetical protein K7G19_21110 [Cupriavidus sp. DB3]|uniref:hypothetical protein n=1 Tax=Cupriavidus sp. DB3 TaxID=2873259 RepID=UPI001CF51888|nr:hypothetical protein [Cupriavidus sp. DB3]MCA7086094.1 hypothetical protein [Cupriavidus sp. DB3]